MWVENIRTNKKWFVTEELGNRLLRNEDYTECAPSEVKEKPKAPAKKKTID